ncbi:MAG: 2-phospho-L-lactate transferase [Caulobacterales bacterium]
MNVVVLTGGVGGAKLVRGLMLAMPAERITAIVNTGDDFQHLGLHVSPDIDTLLYTLSGKANKAQGWGREGETWRFLEAARSLGAPDWFQLGDGDLALHVLRSARLAAGDKLSAVIADFAAAWGIGVRILPMSNQPISTIIDTDEGVLEFQRYFVERRCAPRAFGIRFRGVQDAEPAPGVLQAIAAADAILVAPSNPYLSIDPILATPALAPALRAAAAPVIAVSPIIGGKAVKGPTAKLMQEFGAPVNNASIAQHYGGLLNGMLIDEGDPAPPGDLMIERTRTLMKSDSDRRRVAEAALKVAVRLGRT